MGKEFLDKAMYLNLDLMFMVKAITNTPGLKYVSPPLCVYQSEQ